MITKLSVILLMKELWLLNSKIQLRSLKGFVAFNALFSPGTSSLQDDI